MLRGCRNIFEHFQQCLEVLRKSLEVAGTFSEIPVMTRRKSHAFDSDKVGRYIYVTRPKSSRHLAVYRSLGIKQSVLGLEDSEPRNEIQWKVKHETLFFTVLDQFKGETTSHSNF